MGVGNFLDRDCFVPRSSQARAIVHPDWQEPESSRPEFGSEKVAGVSRRPKVVYLMSPHTPSELA